MILSSIPKTNYATEPRLNRTSETKLVSLVDESVYYDTLEELVNYFSDQDIIVVNDSAVIPASFHGYHYPSNKIIEFRLVRFLGLTRHQFKYWEVVVYGQGNWKIKTEDRLLPPNICVGDLLICNNLVAEVKDISNECSRLLRIEFLGTNTKILSEIYKNGKLIQYSYLHKELDLWDHQTIFSSYPVSIEPSSSVFQLSWKIIFKLKEKGVKIVPITHAISISSTGIPEIDRKLPLSERYWLSSKSADALNEALTKKKNIIAFGTSMTRALESAITSNNIFESGSKEVDLIIDKDYKLKVVNGILTGMHMINESHINLLQSFLPYNRIMTEYYNALKKNFLWHEYGDSMFIKTN